MTIRYWKPVASSTRITLDGSKDSYLHFFVTIGIAFETLVKGLNFKFEIRMDKKARPLSM